VDKIFFLLLLIGLSFSVPSCPPYPYHDYVSATSYSALVKPADTLLQYCDWNLGTICLLSNMFNTTEDKRLSIGESIANDSFDDIWNWNSNIRFGKYPPNTSRSSTNIKDAWVSIAYLNPSVYDNGTYLINASSTPLIRHDFTFVIDTRKLPGDCKDTFRICGYDYSISIVNTSSVITAILNVRSEYLVDRYHLVTHCDLTGCWVTCDYYRTDSFRDSLTVSDSKNIRILNFNSTANYSMLAYYNGLSEIQINANDSNVLFQIGNSSFYKTDYFYRIRNEAGPYNILIKEVIPVNKTSAYGLSIFDQSNSSFRILAPYSADCSLKISDHFSSGTISGCNNSNLSNSTPIPEIHPIRPPFFDSVFNAVLLGLIAYVIYLIVKKVMPVA